MTKTFKNWLKHQDIAWTLWTKFIIKMQVDFLFKKKISIAVVSLPTSATANFTFIDCGLV